jgi:hypothetical protein
MEVKSMLFSRVLKNLCTAGLVIGCFAAQSQPLAAQELTRPLTAQEVACNERQLEHLLHRMNAGKETYFTPQLATHLFVSYSTAAGSYDGVVATIQRFRLDIGEIPPTLPYEHYLAFHVNSSLRGLLLNPERPVLPQISLDREQSGSSLVTPGGYFDLTLELDPTLGGEGPLKINNFREPAEGQAYNGFRANSSGPGRGLGADGLLTSCHDKFSAFDRHVFTLLQRMVRAEVMSEFFDPDMKFAIFRGTDPHSYRINLYPIYESYEARGRMAIELKISWSPQGKLTTAELIALPGCTVPDELGCSALTWSSPIVFLIPPVFGGQELYNQGEVSDSVYFRWHLGPSSPATVDLGKLLAHTTWNEPVW